MSKPFLKPSTMYFTRKVLGCVINRLSNKSTFILQGFDVGRGRNGALASLVGRDEVGGCDSITGGEVVVGQTTLTAGMVELARWFCTWCVRVEPPTRFLVWGNVGSVVGLRGIVVVVGVIVVVVVVLTASKSPVRRLMLVLLMLLVLGLLLALWLGKRFSDGSRNLAREVP